MPTITPIKGGFRISHTTREVWGVDDDDAPATIHERIEPVMARHAADKESDALAAYEMCEEFREYLLAYVDWQSAHATYRLAPTTAARNALTAAEHYKAALLEIARKTPEHKLAFGY